MEPNQHRVAVAFGANLDDPTRMIREAAEMLRQRAVPDLLMAPLYRTVPVDCRPGTPAFINTVGVGRSSMPPLELLMICKRIETELGRPEDRGRNAPRVIDLDILLWNGNTVNRPELTIPHPRMVDRLFVLKPLADVAPSWPVPGTGKRVAQLLAERLASEGTQWGSRLENQES